MAQDREESQSKLGCLLAFVIVLALLYSQLPTLIALVNAWPPAFIERRTQRQQVFERAQAAGGWQSLQKDCAALIAENRGTGFSWLRAQTNLLPASIAALNPTEVRFTDVQPEVVHIKVFGYRSTDGHQPPYFGLEVVSGTGAGAYKPRHMRFEIVTTNIYAVYP